MDVKPRETVVMAEDQAKLAEWYQKALGLSVKDKTITEEYTYYDLGNDHGLKVGIADAKKMGVTPADRKNNTVLLQVGVADLKAFFAHLSELGGAVTFGPSFDENGKFWYGGCEDPEGNPIWVVDFNCP